jgi:hypothetical protein
MLIIQGDFTELIPYMNTVYFEQIYPLHYISKKYFQIKFVPSKW